MLDNIYIIVVIYNQKIEDVDYFNKTKRSYEDIELIICDNSDDFSIKKTNRERKKTEKYIYIDMKGNKGLSLAYNTAIDYLFKINKFFWIITLDQDTQLPSNYIKKILECIKNNKDSKVLAPIIKDRKGILSPFLVTKFGYKHNKMTKIDDKTNFYINSGLCINSSVFMKIKYDEKIFLDFVDIDFIKQYKEYFDYRIVVLKDLVLFQNFSGVEKNTINNDIARFKIFYNDGAYFYKKWHLNYSFLLFKRVMSLTIRHQSLKFIKILMEK